MIVPSALNLLIVGAMVIIFTFLWRSAAAQLSDHPVGKAMGVIL